jgi:DNA-binding response OmpR family regulator
MKEHIILIVDDEMIFVQALKNHFMEQERGYVIKTAFDGSEALDIIRKEKIDLMILDLNMPVLDGIELLIELYNKSMWLPIIILTSIIIMTPEEKTNIFEEIGIVEYMEKPVNLERLDKMVEEVLNRFYEYRKPIDSIGLSAILRIIENEKRTGVLTINSGKKTGRIFFRDGDVADAVFAGLHAEEAVIACLKTGSKEKRISVEYIHHEREGKIGKSVNEILSGLE